MLKEYLIRLRDLYGFRPAASWTDYYIGLIGGMLCPYLSMFMLYMLGVADSDAIIIESIINPTTVEYLLFAIGVTFIAPLTEEILFRGFFWGILDRLKFNSVTAMSITTLLFIYAHGEVVHIAGVMPIAFFLGWLRERSGSIFPTILCHAVNNGVASVWIWITLSSY